mgnify:CR=1 FL=1
MKHLIYADNAATTQMDVDVFEAMKPYLLHEYGNASQPYSFARQPKKAIQEARETIASCIGALPEEIYFTSGGTESDNWAIKGITFRNYDHRATITTAFEHHAVLHACEAIERLGCPVAYMWPDKRGFVSPDSLERYITDETFLVSVMYANNELGSIQPIKELCKVAHDHGALFHTDAVQAVGHIPVDVKDIGCDMLSLAGHKFHGPKGVGALYARKGLLVSSLIEGGAQERGKRAGTENIAGIVGMATALKEATDNLDANIAKITKLRDRLIEGLSVISHSILNGPRENRLPGNVNMCFEGIEGESLLLLLDQKGICASSGSACTSGSLDPSHVLLAIGRIHDVAHGSLRLSLCESNTEDEIETIIKAVPEIVDYLRRISPVWQDLQEGKRKYVIQ